VRRPRHDFLVDSAPHMPMRRPSPFERGLDMSYGPQLSASSGRRIDDLRPNPDMPRDALGTRGPHLPCPTPRFAQDLRADAVQARIPFCSSFPVRFCPSAIRAAPRISSSPTPTRGGATSKKENTTTALLVMRDDASASAPSRRGGSGRNERRGYERPSWDPHQSPAGRAAARLSRARNALVTVLVVVIQQSAKGPYVSGSAYRPRARELLVRRTVAMRSRDGAELRAVTRA